MSYQPTTQWHFIHSPQSQLDENSFSEFRVGPSGQAGSSPEPHHYALPAPDGVGPAAVAQPSVHDQQFQLASPRAFATRETPLGLGSYESAGLSYYSRSPDDMLSSSASLDSPQGDASTDGPSPSPRVLPMLPPKLESEAGPSTLLDTVPDAQSTGSATTTTRRKKSTRRKKPFIELAPGQPLTSQGSARERVFLACSPWYVSTLEIFISGLLLFTKCCASRHRKARCNGAKPVCSSCQQRKNMGGECLYDPSPKRRGPDKIPGTRQRMVKNVGDPAVGDLPPARRSRKKVDGDRVTTAPHCSSPETSDRNITPIDTHMSDRVPTSAPSVDEIAASSKEASRQSSLNYRVTSRQHGSTALDRRVIPVSFSHNSPIRSVDMSYLR